MNTAYTNNGALTNSTTGNIFLDIFSNIGSITSDDQLKSIVLEFRKAMVNPETALRILFWSRDCRGGAGRRNAFRAIISDLADDAKYAFIMNQLIQYIPTYGRWDDLLPLVMNHRTRKTAANFIRTSLEDRDVSGLVAKWLPREKSAQSAVAKKLMREWNMNSKQYRQLIVSKTNVIEQQMCAKEFDQIKYEHVPSVAFSRYTNAFLRHDTARILEFKKQLVSGEKKIKAGQLYPYDVLRTARNGDAEIAQAQWDALENFITEGVSILPIIDVSSSMTCKAVGSLSCMDIAISIGAYVSQKQKSAFKDSYLTFSSTPSLVTIPKTGSIAKTFEFIQGSDWGGSTNFGGSMELILATAKMFNVKQEDMPNYLMCVSDMQFNIADMSIYSGNATNFDVVKQKFEDAGYTMPKLIFWQVNGKLGDFPVTKDQENVILLSGFSVDILKSVLGGDIPTPIDMMMKVVYNPRYDFIGEILAQ